MSSLHPRTRAQRSGLWHGTGLFLLMPVLPAPEGFSKPARRAAGSLLGSVPVERACLWVNILGWGVIIAVSAVTLPWLV